VQLAIVFTEVDDIIYCPLEVLTVDLVFNQITKRI